MRLATRIVVSKRLLEIAEDNIVVVQYYIKNMVNYIAVVSANPNF
jgi:hypothetical protein